MSQTGVLIRFFAKEGLKEALATHLLQTASFAEQEAGTLIWTVHTSPSDSEVVWVYEIYRDDRAREAHEGTPAYVNAKARTGELLSKPPEVFPLMPIGGKGL